MPIPRFQPSFGRRRARALTTQRAEALYALLPQFVITLPESGKICCADYFPRAEALWLEIGFGGGEHLLAQARAHPAIGMMGAEVFENGVIRAVRAIKEENTTNIRLFPDDVRLLLLRLPDACLDRVFILFPDPWPKRKHSKRRLINPETLGLLARVMKKGATLRIATDDVHYLRFILAQLLHNVDFAWQAVSSKDWLTPPLDHHPTRYEAKARKQGKTPIFLNLIRV